MFLFSCRPGEKVVLIGRDVTVEVVDVMSNRVRVGVEAPNGVRVVRTTIRDLPCPAPAVHYLSGYPRSRPGCEGSPGPDSPIAPAPRL